MGEKHLTEAGWKPFITKANSKTTAPLGVFLKAYQDLKEEEYHERREALAKVETEAKKQLKPIENSRPQKAMADWLKEVVKEIGVADKAVVAAEKKAVEEAEAEQSIDPAAVKKKLIALLGRIRQPADPQTPPYTFMAAIAGGESRILLEKKVGNAQRETLKKMLPGEGAPKYFSGVCIWEEQAHTFVLQKVPGGLAKRIASALQAETGVKYKVRVRGVDGGSVADSDTEAEQELPEDSGEAPEAPAPPPAAGSPQAEYSRQLKELKPGIEKVLSGTTAVTGQLRGLLEIISKLAGGGHYAQVLPNLTKVKELVETGLEELSKTAFEAGDPAELFKRRLTELMPGIKEAIAAGGPAANEIRLQTSEAAVLAKKKEFAEALAKIELAAKLLGGKPKEPTVPPKTQTPEGATNPTEGQAGKESPPKEEEPTLRPAPEPVKPSEKGRLAEAGIQWQRDHSYVQGAVDKLAAAMRKALQTEPDFAAMQAKITEMETAFAGYNDRLTAKLDQSVQAAAEQQAKLRGEAKTIAEEYLGMVNGGSWFLRGLEDNPFAPTDVRFYLQKSLPALSASLS